MSKKKQHEECYGNLMSRRANYDRTEIKPAVTAPTAETGQEEDTAPEVATSNPPSDSAGAPVNIGNPNMSFEYERSSYSSNNYPTLSASAPRKVVQYVAMAPIPQQAPTTYQIAPVPAPVALKRPENCVFTKASRRMYFSYRFTMEECINMDTTMTSSLSPAAQIRLAIGQNIFGSETSNALVPLFIMPTEVTLVSTLNTSPVSYVGITPWITEQTTLLDSGQVGSFLIHPGSRTIGEYEGAIFTMSKAVFEEIRNSQYLIGRTIEGLRRDANMSETMFIVNPGTDLHRVILAFSSDNALNHATNDSMRISGPYFENLMKEIGAAIKIVNRYVTTPDRLKVKLEHVRPPNSRAELSAEGLLDIVLGDIAPDSTEAKVYYTKKANVVSVCLDVTYAILV